MKCESESLVLYARTKVMLAFLQSHAFRFAFGAMQSVTIKEEEYYHSGVKSSSIDFVLCLYGRGRVR